MSAGITSGSAKITGRFFLRWSDSPGLPVREEPVEVIEISSTELNVRCASGISAETEVFLIGDKYTKNGLVRSCFQQGSYFLLIIHINSEYIMSEMLPLYDPGAFAVDDFLTEEEEAKILGSLDGGHNERRKSRKQLNLFSRLTEKIAKAFMWCHGSCRQCAQIVSNSHLNIQVCH